MQAEFETQYEITSSSRFTDVTDRTDQTDDARIRFCNITISSAFCMSCLSGPSSQSQQNRKIPAAYRKMGVNWRSFWPRTKPDSSTGKPSSLTAVSTESWHVFLPEKKQEMLTLLKRIVSESETSGKAVSGTIRRILDEAENRK